MTILFDSTRRVKAASFRAFAAGLSLAARKPYSAADAAWWAAVSNADAADFDVLGPSDAALDFAAAEAEATDRMSAGLAVC